MVTNEQATVFITGVSRGIGQGLALDYLRSGWQVIGTTRRTADGQAVVAGGGTVLPLDVADPESVDALRERLHGTPIDVLINNAGMKGPEPQSSASMDFDGFALTLAVNTLGPLRVTQALLPNLRAGRNPRLINVSSRMGSLSYSKSDTVAYRASKAALNKITQCLATDLQAQGIAVAAVHPGWVVTDIGGPDAELDVATSALGVRTVIDQLTLASTGGFWNYDGARLDW